MLEITVRTIRTRRSKALKLRKALLDEALAPVEKDHAILDILKDYLVLLRILEDHKMTEE